MPSQINSRLTWPHKLKEHQIQELRRQQFPPTSRHDRLLYVESKMLPIEVRSWCLWIFHCRDGGSRDTSNLDRTIATAGSTSMTKAQVYKLDLKTLNEPDDLWGKLFLTGLKAHSEENDMSFQMLTALKEAVVHLDRAVSELSPEKLVDLRAAMKTIQDVEEAWKQQSIRRLDNVERAAVIAKKIIASRKSE